MIKKIWTMVQQTECSAIAVFVKNNEQCFDFLVQGENRRIPIDNFGILLVLYKKEM